MPSIWLTAGQKISHDQMLAVMSGAHECANWASVAEPRRAISAKVSGGEYRSPRDLHYLASRLMVGFPFDSRNEMMLDVLDGPCSFSTSEDVPSGSQMFCGHSFGVPLLRKI